MNHSPTIEEIRQRHEAIYGELLRNPALAKSSARRDAFLAEQVYPLLNDMKAIPATAMSVEDYTWLSDTVIQWQVVFSSVFNIPRTIQIVVPRQLNPPTEQYTPDRLEELLRGESFFLGQSRMLAGLIEYIRHYRSSRDEMARDWHNAEVILASFLLEGKINFARQILPESYYHVEAVWLDELRLVTAYFHWLAEGRNLWNAEADFDYASTHIRERLLDPRVKASRWDFERVQGYLEEQYLAGGQLDLTAQAVVDLTTRKAYRLWEKTGESDSEANWLHAQGYVEAFYGNIVAAVTESDVDSIAAVLSALQGQARPEHDAMINAFEALIAIYFLDPEILHGQFGELLESVL